MKLHTSLTDVQVSNALYREVKAGRIHPSVHFTQFTPDPSKSRPNGFLVRLGTYDQETGPHNSKRNYSNSGTHGADSTVWAATWYEWGYFIAAVFNLDPDAFWTNYTSRDDFNEKTYNVFTDLPYAVVDFKRNELRRKAKPGDKLAVMGRFATAYEAEVFIARKLPPLYVDAGDYSIDYSPDKEIPAEEKTPESADWHSPAHP